jgi:hypothetical protein
VAQSAAEPSPGGSFKDVFLAEIRRGKQTLYELAVAQARRIDVADDRVTFTFPANQNVPRVQLEQNRSWLEAAAERVAGRRITVAIVQADSQDAAPRTAEAVKAEAPKRDLKAEAKSSPTVQAMLEVFPAEIRDVEEM